MRGISHDVGGTAPASAGLNVIQGRETAVCDLLGGFNDSLQGRLTRCRAAPIPDSDGGCQCALHHTPVKGGEDSRTEASLLQPPEEVPPQALVSLLEVGSGVGTPRQVA